MPGRKIPLNLSGLSEVEQRNLLTLSKYISNLYDRTDPAVEEESLFPPEGPVPPPPDPPPPPTRKFYFSYAPDFTKYDFAESDFLDAARGSSQVSDNGRLFLSFPSHRRIAQIQGIFSALAVPEEVTLTNFWASGGNGSHYYSFRNYERLMDKVTIDGVICNIYRSKTRLPVSGDTFTLQIHYNEVPIGELQDQAVSHRIYVSQTTSAMDTTAQFSDFTDPLRAGSALSSSNSVSVTIPFYVGPQYNKGLIAIPTSITLNLLYAPHSNSVYNTGLTRLNAIEINGIDYNIYIYTVTVKTEGLGGTFRISWTDTPLAPLNPAPKSTMAFYLKTYNPSVHTGYYYNRFIARVFIETLGRIEEAFVGGTSEESNYGISSVRASGTSQGLENPTIGSVNLTLPSLPDSSNVAISFAIPYQPEAVVLNSLVSAGVDIFSYDDIVINSGTRTPAAYDEPETEYLFSYNFIIPKSRISETFTFNFIQIS